MTVKLYLANNALTGVAEVTAIGHDERPWVRLHKTLFHPQGGGQRTDIGTIDGVAVVHVAHAAEKTEVNHYLINSDHPFKVGQQVALEVDDAARFNHSRLHTSGHLIASVGEALFPTLRAVGGHHWPNEARVEFEGSLEKAIEANGLDGVKSLLQYEIQRAIDENLIVGLEGDPYRERTVRIGNLCSIPCGGTHVESLQSIGRLILTDIKRKKGLIRLSYATEDVTNEASSTTF